MASDGLKEPRNPREIDASSDEEIRYWARELGVENVAIIDAVEKVGRNVDDVRRHLDQMMAGGQSGG